MALNLEVASPKDPEAQVTYWLEQLRDAEKREKDWRKAGADLCELYASASDQGTHFNILYANTEVLAPALFNQIPRVSVQRRYKTGGKVEKAAAMLVKRVLEYLMDQGDPRYPAFDTLIDAAVQNALVPGRGQVMFELEETTICGRSVGWNKHLYGYADNMADIPWKGFFSFLTPAEVKENYGDLDIPLVDVTIEPEDKASSRVKELQTVKAARVWAIWDKVKRRVVHISPDYPKVLKDIPDPLELTGFYPCPAPLILYKKLEGNVPVALYEAYRQQAEELNLVSKRIKLIVRAIRARGFYDSQISGLDDLFKEEDNKLIPADNIAALQQLGGLEKGIWFFPVEKLVAVLQQLYVQREQLKGIIYEIIGISDILRGSSRASETATAQGIKDKWGGLRLKRGQKLVAQFAREALRIMAEMAVSKLDPQVLMKMAELSFPSREAQQQAQVEMRQIQEQVLAMQQAQQPPPPQLQQRAMQLQQLLAEPAMEDVFGLLQDDVLRNFAIDIETNSTVDLEATEDKEAVAEFLNALSQFLNGVAPMVQEKILPFGAAKAMLLAVSRRFRFGQEVDDQLEMMQEPQNQGPDPKQLEKMSKELEARGEKVKQEEMALQGQKQELELAKQGFEQDKQFALKEIDMSKKFAAKELQMAEKQAHDGLKQALGMAQETVGMQKQAGQQELDFGRQKLSEEAKAQKQAAAAQQKFPTAEDIAMETAQALAPLLQQMQQMTIQAIAASARLQRTAKKNPDGSWSSALMEPTLQ